MNANYERLILEPNPQNEMQNHITGFRFFPPHLFLEVILTFSLADKLDSNFHFTFNISNKTRLAFLNIPKKVS